MAKLKVAGAWSGMVEVELDKWTVRMLRKEVGKRSGLDPGSIKIIFAGKILSDGDGDGDGAPSLSQLGMKENAKILSNCKICFIFYRFLAEHVRSRRLARVKAAAAALTERHADGSLPLDDYNIELEDQRGEKVQFGTKTDQSAVMMGLMLHAKAKNFIKKEKYSDALEVLVMAEEALLLCDPKVIELVDNVPIIQIDMVWCYFLLRDLKWLSDAGLRLEKAREGLERSYGKDFSRVRLLQAGLTPELALYLRLELLEGVVAYHSGKLDKAANTLRSAHAKFSRLQVPDEALSQVMSMGFNEKNAKRALRLNSQDVGTAVEFLIEEKAKRAQKRKENLQRQKEIMEQKRYGVTPLKKAVDMQMLNRLASIGYARDLSAEALRRNENDFQKALDALTTPDVNSEIQVYIESRKRKRREQLLGVTVDQLVSMGFEQSIAISALEAGGNREEILERLLSLQQANPQVASFLSAALNSTNPSGGRNSLGLRSGEGEGTSNESGGGVSDETGYDNAIERDAEMEDELTEDVAQIDALSAYDIDLTREGDAINEYLSMLASTNSC
ncbi:PREDICTED: NEDD8 ultimate buster 1 [Tarenaya hassleriana]|uniref:NEDD8 ultimate buster 1 n=1 Tax=Tarenaya hassleriana TaxID=28532 RepID=UPI00053C57BF|nr:PREDICTED: NEDD8 ultimate buster 1 [Tarenaya hassleriana]